MRGPTMNIQSSYDDELVNAQLLFAVAAAQTSRYAGIRGFIWARVRSPKRRGNLQNAHHTQLSSSLRKMSDKGAMLVASNNSSLSSLS